MSLNKYKSTLAKIVFAGIGFFAGNARAQPKKMNSEKPSKDNHSNLEARVARPH